MFSSSLTHKNFMKAETIHFIMEIAKLERFEGPRLKDVRNHFAPNLLSKFQRSLRDVLPPFHTIRCYRIMLTFFNVINILY
jgi:hypothetical protein